MVRALNYLYSLEGGSPDFQYIVTINRDEFGAVESRFKFAIEDKVKKILTRDEPLFGVEYSEESISLKKSESPRSMSKKDAGARAQKKPSALLLAGQVNK
jgi:hypothetical protein